MPSSAHASVYPHAAFAGHMTNTGETHVAPSVGGGKRDRATFKWTNEELPAGEEQALHKCAICLEPLDGDTTPTVICGHVFHTLCRTTYLRNCHPADWVCPVCRERMFVCNAERARLREPETASGGATAARRSLLIGPTQIHGAERSLDLFDWRRTSPPQPTQNDEQPVLVDFGMVPGIARHGPGLVAHRHSIEYRRSDALIFGLPCTNGDLWNRILNDRSFILFEQPTRFQLWRVSFVEIGEMGTIGLLHPGHMNREIRAGDVFTLASSQVHDTPGFTDTYNVFLEDGVTRWRPWQILEQLRDSDGHLRQV